MALNINGTTGISGVDGSASAPALQGTDSNTGLSFGTDTVNINTGGSTKASISSVGKLTLTSTETSNSNPVVLNASGQAYFQVITPNNTIGGIKFGDVDDGDVGAIKYGHGDNRMQFDVNGSERMRITSAGNVGIGTTSPDRLFDIAKDGASVSRFQQLANNTDDGKNCITIRHNGARSGQDGVGVLFQNSGGSVCGKILMGQSTTAYNTSSDYRLKENAEAISDGITKLKTLKPYRFNWIAEKGQPKVDGFFAHEVTAVPEAISGTKDEVDANNNPVYQGIDQSKLVPLLTAALQEAIAKIEVLETKVAALEAA